MASTKTLLRSSLALLIDRCCVHLNAESGNSISVTSRRYLPGPGVSDALGLNAREPAAVPRRSVDQCSLTWTSEYETCAGGGPMA